MARVTINERKLASLAKQAKSWPSSRKLIVSDAVVPGAAACVRGATGQISLGMVARFPLHPKNPTFRKYRGFGKAMDLSGGAIIHADERMPTGAIRPSGIRQQRSPVFGARAF
jgi:hypothetical protein